MAARGTKRHPHDFPSVLAPGNRGPEAALGSHVLASDPRTQEGDQCPGP